MRINFSIPLTSVPQIMISPTQFDMTKGFPVDWEIKIINIDKNGFNY
jgi:hypothetical protein